jgi:hypothetical protein
MENLANMESRVTENSATMESRVTENSADTESRVTDSSANTENRIMQDLGGRGAGNRKKENVLLQAKGQLHDGAQGVLPRHKNADCERSIKESWLRKSRTIGLTVYGP